MRDFDDVVKQIGNAEKDVDKVLKAGRLGRHEKSPAGKECLELILGYIAGYLAMLLMFGLFFMMFYFG